MAFLIGGLVPTFLISRILLAISAKFAKKKFYVTANTLSLLLSAFLYAFGSSEKYPDLFIGLISGLTLYAVPQFVWLAVDFFRFQKNCSHSESGDKNKPETAAKK